MTPTATADPHENSLAGARAWFAAQGLTRPRRGQAARRRDRRLRPPPRRQRAGRARRRDRRRDRAHAAALRAAVDPDAQGRVASRVGMAAFALRFPPEEIEPLALRFPAMDDGPYLAAGAAAAARGHYRRAEFLLVCGWKSPRSRPLVAANPARRVAARTRAAFAAGDETRAHRGAAVARRRRRADGLRAAALRLPRPLSGARRAGARVARRPRPLHLPAGVLARLPRRVPRARGRARRDACARSTRPCGSSPGRPVRRRSAVRRGRASSRPRSRGPSAARS